MNILLNFKSRSVFFLFVGLMSIFSVTVIGDVNATTVSNEDNDQTKNDEDMFKLKVKLNKNNQEHMLPPFIKNINKITLANSWLAGYADSRFLFYARWHKSKRLKAGKKLYTVIFVWDLYENFLIKLKDDLNLKNKIEFKSKMNLPFFKLAIDDLNEKNIFNKYFEKYKLRSIKAKKYMNWKDLLNYENIDDSDRNFEKIERIFQKISLNKEEDEICKI